MEPSIPDYFRTRILVVGDVMLDRYWYGSTGRISPEAPVPVVKVGGSEERPGGAGNVAVNIAALGAKCAVIGIAGRDETAQALQSGLQEAGVDCRLHCHPDIATIAKLRVISRHQQLLRLDFEHALDAFANKDFTAAFSAAVADYDIVVFSDYAKGTLKNIQSLISAARKANKKILVDPKGKDFSRYRGATLLTPNAAEFENVVGVCRDENEFIAKADRLRAELEIDALLITRGEHGMSLFQASHAPLHFSAEALEVFDVTGAGDTVIAVLAATMGAGETVAEAARLANIAAGLVVAKLGAASVTPTELKVALRHRMEGEHRVLTAAELLEIVSDARGRGEKLVMTNGCFDILHAGHVNYLRAAKRLGDRLIVAVNDDESVRRLKGDTRPVVPLAERMAVLAGLDAVDWVVPFSEDTPEKLICKVLPDYLVKGGDYKPEDIAGYKCVIDNGGQVRVLPYLEGASTSEILNRVRTKST